MLNDTALTSFSVAILQLSHHDNPRGSLPRIDTFMPAYEAADLLTAARLGDIVLLRRCLSRSLDVSCYKCLRFISPV